MNSYSSMSSQIKLIAIVAGLAFTLSAGLSMAEESVKDENDSSFKRQGLFIGGDVGFGGASLGYKDGSRSIFEEAKGGATGALRIGMGLSKYFSLSLEGHGFGSTDDSDNDWGLGATAIALTWYPGGGDFFLRTGFGAGGGNYYHPETGEKITIKNRGAALFGLGYDWWLGKSTTLGITATAFSLEGGGKSGFEEDFLGTSSMSVQFNWYL